MITVTKRFEISYAHFLEDYNGGCGNMHGHNAIVELEFARGGKGCVFRQAKIDPTTGIRTHMPDSGMIIDFSAIKKGIEASIKKELDHELLNDLPYFSGIVRPTAENICLFILSRIQTINDADLIRIRVWEDRDSYAEWRNDAYC